MPYINLPFLSAAADPPGRRDSFAAVAAAESSSCRWESKLASGSAGALGNAEYNGLRDEKGGRSKWNAWAVIGPRVSHMSRRKTKIEQPSRTTERQGGSFGRRWHARLGMHLSLNCRRRRHRRRRCLDGPDFGRPGRQAPSSRRLRRSAIPARFKACLGRFGVRGKGKSSPGRLTGVDLRRPANTPAAATTPPPGIAP